MHFTKPNFATVKILKSFEKAGKHFVEISPHPFYPDGSGGQIGDRGTIGSANVLSVNSEFVEVDRALDVGSVVEAKTNSERRKEIARQHTAQHILSAAAEKFFGAKTVGFHMSEEFTTVDLDSDFSVEDVENLTNEIVMSNVNVEEIILSPQEVQKYRLRKPLSKKALESGRIRLIKIGDFDVNACGGFHVSHTGEIGIVKIIHDEKVKGKFTRIWFLAGKRAIKDYQSKEVMLLKTSKLFDSSWKDLKTRVEKCLDESKAKSSKIKKISELLSKYVSKDMKPGDIFELDENVVSYITRSKQDIPYAIKYSSPANVALCIPEMSKEKVLKWARSLNGKGGGRGPIYRFSFEDFEKFKDAFKKFISEK